MGIIAESKAKVKVGECFGLLTVIGNPFTIPFPSGKTSRVVCECKCGTVVVAEQSHVLSGATKSCGCFGKQFNLKHGQSRKRSRTRLYGIWHGMMQRCYRPKQDYYEMYGGRGITVCQEWHDASAFIQWAMSNGYSDSLTIDRIKNHLGYSPDNCRWATKKEQGRNRKTNVHHPAFGECKTLVEWAEDERCVVGFDALRGRMRRKWSLEEAILTPKGG